MDPTAVKPLGLALRSFLKNDKSASFTIILLAGRIAMRPYVVAKERCSGTFPGV